MDLLTPKQKALAKARDYKRAYAICKKRDEKKVKGGVKKVKGGAKKPRKVNLGKFTSMAEKMAYVRSHKKK